MRKLAVVASSLLLTFSFLSPSIANPQGAEAGVEFQDVTAKAGIHFVHNNGAFGKKFLPETVGPGVAFIDYDNDG